jgi:hypothetical protein
MGNIDATMRRHCADPEIAIAARKADETAILDLEWKDKDRAAACSSLEHTTGYERQAELRAALRLAQHERDARRAIRDRLSDAVERAVKLAAMIEVKLAEFADLDKVIAEECAASILRSSESAAEPALELSPKLKKMADRKFSLEKHLAAARQAAECLRRELAATDRDVNEAVLKVENAAVAVAETEMEPIAAELAQVENLAATLRRFLVGYGALRHAGGFLPMSQSAAKLLRAIPKNAHVGGGAQCPESTVRWQSYLQQLSVDSEATFDAGPLS